MSTVNPIWLEGQRKRWLRPDAHLWVRHDAHRFAPPGSAEGNPGAIRAGATKGAALQDAASEAEQEALRTELEHLRWLAKDIRIDLAIRRLRRKYRPDQARDERGRWVDEGQEQADMAVDALGVTIAVEREGVASSRANEDAPPLELIANRSVTTIDYSRALTGTPFIDKATKDLSEILAKSMEKMDFIPEWTPQVYGTAVHVAFGMQVRIAGLDGIGPLDVEHSFLAGESAGYGEAGSIRTDVVLRDIHGEVIAIYDVKTGNADMSQARAREIRDSVGVGLDVPIIQLHVLRGASLKSRIATGKIGHVLPYPVKV